jgi:hypothetical protein
MKFKLFKGPDPDKVEAEVNAWLASEKGRVTIHQANTAMASTTIQGKPVATLLVSVWYQTA